MRPPHSLQMAGLGGWLRNLRGETPSLDLADPGGEAAPLRLLILCEHLAASQQVHFLRPLKHLREQGGCAVCVVSEHGMAKAKPRARARWLRELWGRWKPHAVILSRFGGGEGTLAIVLARASGAAVIAHLDDFLFEVPAALGPDKQRQHNRPERRAALAGAFQAADLIYLSTEPLARKVREAGFDRPILVSALQSGADPEEFAPPAAAKADGEVTIGYQGSRNHGEDLALILPQLMAVMEARPRVRFELFGSIRTPPELERFGDRVARHPPAADYDAFLRRLGELGWDLGLAPLRSTEFNTFRTYTKWVEYGAAGIPVLASDLEPYRDVCAGETGVLAADDGWASALIGLIDEAPRRLAIAGAAQARIRSTLSLDKLGAQVIEMLRQAGARWDGG